MVDTLMGPMDAGMLGSWSITARMVLLLGWHHMQCHSRHMHALDNERQCLCLQFPSCNDYVHASLCGLQWWQCMWQRNASG